MTTSKKRGIDQVRNRGQSDYYDAIEGFSSGSRISLKKYSSKGSILGFFGPPFATGELAKELWKSVGGMLRDIDSDQLAIPVVVNVVHRLRG